MLQKNSFNPKNHKILKPKVTKKIKICRKKFCEYGPRHLFLDYNKTKIKNRPLATIFFQIVNIMSMIGEIYFEWEYFKTGDFKMVILNLILKQQFQKNHSYFKFNFEMSFSILYGFWLRVMLKVRGGTFLAWYTVFDRKCC